MFYISNDDLIDALCYLAAKKNIQVRIVVDEYMNSRAHQAKLEKLSYHGCEIYIESLPKRGKMHMKSAVIDNATVITGAANWTEYAFDQNIEDILIINSPALASQYTQRLNSTIHANTYPFTYSGGGKKITLVKKFPKSKQPGIGRNKLVTPRKKVFSDISSLTIYFCPGRTAIQQILHQIEKAKTVDIGMFLLSDNQTIESLVRIAQKGSSRIRMLVDGTMLTGSLLSTLSRLEAAGIEILYWSEDRSSLHLKSVIIDNQIVWSGSANWSRSAFDKNMEDMIMFESTAMAQHYRLFFDRIAELCTSFHTIKLSSALSPSRSSTFTAHSQGLPATLPRTNFTGTTKRQRALPFTTKAAAEYIDDEEYLPALIRMIETAHQSIFVSMFHIPVEVRKTKQKSIEQVIKKLISAANRGVYVYIVLEIPYSPHDSLDEAHSKLAMRLRKHGIDVRLSLPTIPLHEKLVVVDLCKVLVGSHNWSEGALQGDRVYECSALLVLEHQEPKLAEYILSRKVIKDMSSKEAWDKEITILRHIAASRGNERKRLLKNLSKGSSHE